MTELVKVSGQKLDSDAINCLRALTDTGAATTSELKSRLTHKNNDHTRRRLKWLENAGLVELDKQPWEQNEDINVTVATITTDGYDFLSEWNIGDIGDGVPVEERVWRLESRVDDLEMDKQDLEGKARDLREELDKQEETVTRLKDGFRAVERYLGEEVNVDLRDYSLD